MKHLKRAALSDDGGEDSEDDQTPQHPNFGGGARAVTGIDMFDDAEEIDPAPFRKQLGQ